MTEGRGFNVEYELTNTLLCCLYVSPISLAEQTSTSGWTRYVKKCPTAFILDISFSYIFKKQKLFK